MKYRFKLIVPLTYEDAAVESDEVELTEQEVATICRLVKGSRSRRHGLIPILEDGAPELYDKVMGAIEGPLRRTVTDDGRANGHFDPDMDEREQVDWDCVDFLCQIPIQWEKPYSKQDEITNPMCMSDYEIGEGDR